MNCLVTGGAGFIGSHIVEALLKRGDQVTILDNLTTGNIDNLKPFADQIKFVRGDIRDQASLDEALQNIDVVFHLAAHISVAESMLTPSDTFDINLMGTNLLFQTASKLHIQKVVLSSSAAVYGDQSVLPIKESVNLAPLSPYGSSKQMDEQLAGLFTRSFQLPVACLRYFNAYGPRQNPDSPYAAAIPIFIRKLLKGESIVIYGDGGQTRDFLYVDDIVRANLLAAENPSSDGRIMNICGGAPITILELARLLRTIIPGSPEVVFAPSRPGDIYHSYGDPSLARELLGFNTQVNFADGLRATVDWMRS